MPVSQRRAATEGNAPSHDLFLATGAGSINDLALYFSLAWLADLTLFPNFSIACAIEINDLLVAEKTKVKMGSRARRQPDTMIDIESTLLFQNRRGNFESLLKVGFRIVSASTRTTHTSLDKEVADTANVCLHTILVSSRVL